MSHAVTRRTWLKLAAGASTGFLPCACRAGERRDASPIGLVTYCLRLHQSSSPALRSPQGFLDECWRLGAAGMQLPLGIREKTEMVALRRESERRGMAVEAILGLPQRSVDGDRFEQEIVTARAAGVTVARTVMLPGRRYEQFKTRTEFVRACAAGLRALQRAEPIAARHGLRLAVENHKDHLVEEKLDVLRRLSSEYVGLCLDVGNNLALMEDPVEVVRAFAPWVMTVHIKDQAVHACPEGFWLSDVALGDGILDLPSMVSIVRDVRPAARFHLESITRDPILVPVLLPGYGATFSPSRHDEIARRTKALLTKSEDEPLLRLSVLTHDEQLATEHRTVRRSLHYAQTVLWS